MRLSVFVGTYFGENFKSSFSLSSFPMKHEFMALSLKRLHIKILYLFPFQLAMSS